MKKVRIKINPDSSLIKPKGRVDLHKLDATSEEDIARQQHEDDIDAMQDAARYTRKVRQKLGFTQSEFSNFINVPVDTIRNWEQGKRCPTGAARTLLKVLNNAPEAAREALRQ